MKLIDCLLLFSVVLLIFGIVSGVINGATKDTILTIKPTSIAQLTGFIILACFVEKARPWIRKLSMERIRIVILLLFMMLMLFGYETLWVFHYWFSIYGITQVNIDEISYNTNDTNNILRELMDNPNYKPINLNSMSKIHVGFFFLVLYALYVVFDEKRGVHYEG